MGVNGLNNRILTKKENVVSRERGIELLRIVLMFMIVCYHLFSFSIKEPFFSNNSLYMSKLIMTTLIFNGYVGVVCFIFISGYFGIKFKLKQVTALLLQAFFYSYICLIVFSLFSDIDLSTDNLISFLLPVSSSLWWFFSTYLLLYFISPFLNSGIKSLTKRQFQLFLLCFLFFNCFSNFIYDLKFGGQLLNFIFIYLLGRYIYIYQVNIKRPFTLYITLLISIFLLNYLAGMYLNRPVLSASRYTSIFIVLAAVCIFFTFKNIKIQANWIVKISPLCFGVYLLHFNYFTWYGVIHPFLYKIDFLYKHNQSMFILSTIVLALIVFIICLSIEKIRQILCKPILNFIDKKLDKLNLNI